MGLLLNQSALLYSAALLGLFLLWCVINLEGAF